MLRSRVLLSSYRPSAIRYHKEKKMLEVSFLDGKNFMYLAEYLRVFSPAASAHAIQEHDIAYAPKVLIPQRSGIEIMEIERIGSYALAFHFDDMHSEGIYSWEFLYELGENKIRNMRAYIRLLRFYKKSRTRPRIINKKESP